MFILALICVAAGTWQISRFEQSVHDNDAIVGNAHAASVPLTTALVPLVGQGPAPGRDAIRYRSVTLTGSYLAGAQQFLGNEVLNGTDGYYVVNPLRTATGLVLVVRGFVAANDAGTPPATLAAPPAGTVHITGRLQTAGTENDASGQLADHQIASINPTQQAARLGAPVYAAYVALDAHQPGASGVTVLPDPDLSNPAGGVVAPQHFAYIIQWYLFALLALAAPFAMGRHEVREARRSLLGIDTGDEELGAATLDQGNQLPQSAAGSSSGALAVRASGTIAQRGEPTPQQWRRAAQLADRYGRSLGADPGRSAGRGSRTTRIGKRPNGDGQAVTQSATAVHRSNDAYHGAYNDYLWQLALADGTAPDLSAPRAPEIPDQRTQIDGDSAPQQLPPRQI
ncbi:MAG: SURF1 family protein [Jatrophihabitantaceae bacterium]